MTRNSPLSHYLLLLPLLAACERRGGGQATDDPLGVCAAEALPPRQLRLLTRREYNAAVAELLGGAGAVCALDTDCEVLSQSCVGGTCQDDPCTRVTFTFDPGATAWSSVTVAGTFNGWDPAAAGWAMDWSADRGLWLLKASLDEGQHQYKFVADGGTWFHDTANPLTVNDGYGGYNSVLTLGCEDDAGTPAEDLPAETRPDGYLFDNNAEVAVVTATHVELYLRAAEDLAERALVDPVAFAGCDPDAVGPAACADDWVRRFGRRAFRRALTEEEVGRYTTAVLAQAEFVDGLSVALQTFLSSPYFLYRFELGTDQGGGVYRLSAAELASALSFTYWGSPPDEALLAAAESGALDTPAGLEAEVRRLVADPRAQVMLGTFVVQWLGVEKVLTADKSTAVIADYDALREDLQDELRAFVAHVTWEGSGRYEELLTAPYSFINQDLAAIYGVEGVSGAELRQVELPAGERAGLLTSAGWLGAMAHSDQSSPILRGVALRERVLCQELPVPPADVPSVPEVDANATTRERFAQHTADPTCAACHQFIDPVGFGFEAYDAVGRFRTEESGQPIDASGDMVDLEELGADTSAPFHTAGELALILAGSTSGPTCFTRSLRRFALGYQEEGADLCAVNTLADDFIRTGGDLQELWVSIALDPGFVLREER